MKISRIIHCLCIAVSMITVSCQEGPIDNPDPKKDQPAGPRTLTVSIAATKTSLNGQQPEWSAGDQIWVKGIQPGALDSTYTVPSDAVGKVSFTLTTWIEGDIVAVYPASAKIDNEPYFSVDHKQDGSFANANICVARAVETETSLIFKNMTALFEIEVPEGTNKLTVSSLGTIETNNGQRGTIKKPINSSTKSDEKYEIVVSKKDGEVLPNTCYISVLTSSNESENVILTDLNFDVAYGDKTAMGGFPPNKLRGVTDTDNSVESVCKKYNIKQNGHYTLGEQYFHEYKDIVISLGWGNKIIYRWATTNIGASIKTDAGEYFAWGETKGHICDESNDTFKGYSFNMQNCPYYLTDGTNEGYSKYICDYTSGPTLDNKNILELYDDAAFANWGGAWCMPDGNAIGFLSNNQDRIPSEGGSSFGTGDNAIFIPAAGDANGEKRTRVKNGNSYGRYWSSNLDSSQSIWATSALILDEQGTENSYRFIGRPIRPYGGIVQ